VLSVPVWRLVGTWHRPFGPDDSPRWHLARRMIRFLAIAAVPAVLVWVIVIWAVLRGYLNQDGSYPVPSYAVVLLVLILAATTMGLEILVSNPYARADREAAADVGQATAQYQKLRSRSGESLAVLEREWRNLRSARDELLSKARVEMGRAWETLILPARLRHGRAGVSPPPLIGVEPRPDPDGGAPLMLRGLDQNAPSSTADDVGEGARGELDEKDVHAVLQFFSGVHQPPPGLGPLAETVRAVTELSPEGLREERDQMCRLIEQRYLPEVGEVLAPTSPQAAAPPPTAVAPERIDLDAVEQSATDADEDDEDTDAEADQDTHGDGDGDADERSGS